MVSQTLILLVALFLRSARANSARMINSSSSKVTLETCPIDKSYPAQSLRITDNLPLHLTLHANLEDFGVPRPVHGLGHSCIPQGQFLGHRRLRVYPLVSVLLFAVSDSPIMSRVRHHSFTCLTQAFSAFPLNGRESLFGLITVCFPFVAV